jgi:tetratricopeptide (TPR) repeat protein
MAGGEKRIRLRCSPRWAFGAGIVLLGLYLATLSGEACPGASAGMLAANLGLQPWPSAEHPLWRLWAWLWRGLPLGTPVWRLNFSSAFAAAAAGALLCDYVARWVLQRFDTAEQERQTLERLPFVAGASGLIAALLFGTSLAGWSAAVRFHTLCFDLLLVLAGLTLLERCLRDGAWWALYALAFLCGLGVAETAMYAILAPLFVAGAIVALFRFHRLPMHAIFGLLAAGCLGAALYVLSASLYAAGAVASFGSPQEWTDALRQVIKAQVREVLAFVPRVGWLTVVFVLVVPWTLLYAGGWERLCRRRGIVSDLLLAVAALGVALLQFDVGIAPWTEGFRLNGRMPVLEMALVAMMGGWVAAYWLSGLFAPSTPPEKDNDSLPARRSPARPAGLGFRGVLAAAVSLAFVLAVAAAAFANGFRMERGRGDFASRYARDVFDQLGTRTWLATDGLLDAQLRLLAFAQKRPLHLVNLAADRDPVQGHVLRQQIAADPSLAPLRGRLRNATALGAGAFIREWLAADRAAAERIALYGVPDIWVEAGRTPRPDRLLFLPAPSLESLRNLPLLAEHRPFWDHADRLLAMPAEEREPTDRLRRVLRRHVALVANDLGVLLQGQGRPEDAHEAYRQALHFEPESLSALLNRALLLRSETNTAARAAADKAVAEALAEYPWRPTVFDVVRQFGNLCLPEAFAGLGAGWAVRGQYSLARGAMQRAVDTAVDDTRRDRLLRSLGAMSLRAGDAKASEETFTRLLDSRTGASGAMLGMASVALARGEVAAARNWLDRALAAGASTAATERLAIRLDIADGRLDEAGKRLLAYTDRVPKDLEAWSLLAVTMIQQGRAKAAEAEVLPRMLAATERRQHPLVFQVQGMIAQAKGQAFYPAAREAFRSAAALLPRRSDLRAAILEIDVALQDDDAVAASDAIELLRLERDNALAHFVLGSQASRGGRIEDAEWHLRSSVAGSPTASAWNNLASVLCRRGALDEAEDAARRAVSLATNNAAIRDTLANVLFEKGRIAEAQEVIQAARTLDPKDVRVAFTAARVLWRARQCREAREALRLVEQHLDAMPPPLRPEVARLAALWDAKF